MNEIYKNVDPVAFISILFPIRLFDYIVKIPGKYAFNNWVAPVEVVDRDC